MHEGVERALAEARALGFLGPGPLEHHEVSADTFAAALGSVAAGASILDLGSGGGVPGLLLADRFDDVRWVLLDNNRRRTSFLARAVADLGWGGRVDVVRAAAEDAGRDPRYRAQFDAVVSRSFGPPAATAECAAAFLRRGGRLLVAEPPTVDDARWPEPGLAELGLERVSELDAPVAVLLQRREASPDVARPWKTMERHPRW